MSITISLKEQEALWLREIVDRQSKQSKDTLPTDVLEKLDVKLKEHNWVFEEEGTDVDDFIKSAGKQLYDKAEDFDKQFEGLVKF